MRFAGNLKRASPSGHREQATRDRKFEFFYTTLVDKNALFATLLRLCLDKEPDYACLREVGDGKERSKRVHVS